jgi:hypothetical protein
LAPGALHQATGLALDDKYAYVSNHGYGGRGAGQVVRIRLNR